VKKIEMEINGRMKKNRGRIVFIRILVYFVSVSITLLCFFPVYTLLISSTRSTFELLRGFSLIPGNEFIINLKKISFDLFGINIWRAMINSAIVSIFTSVGAVYVSSMTAYAIQVYKTKSNKFFYAFIVALIMIPVQVNIVGFYKFASSLKLLNTYAVLILPAVAAPATVFFIKQYLESVWQVSIVEAARIDGAGEFYIFNRIMLPIMTPAVATMGLMTFVTSWNSFIAPNILINKMKMYTIPLTIVLLNFDRVTPDFGARFAALALSLIPIIGIYVFTGRYIIRGISLGGVKE
jgi:multiple sugar transport system permease protein